MRLAAMASWTCPQSPHMYLPRSQNQWKLEPLRSLEADTRAIQRARHIPQSPLQVGRRHPKPASPNHLALSRKQHQEWFCRFSTHARRAPLLWAAKPVAGRVSAVSAGLGRFTKRARRWLFALQQADARPNPPPNLKQDPLPGSWHLALAAKQW